MNHRRLVREILRNFRDIFNDEIVELSKGEKLAGEGFIHSDILESTKPDLMGYDAEGNLLLVKVMSGVLKPNGQYDRTNARKTIGHTLEYMSAFLRNESYDLFSDPSDIPDAMEGIALRIISDAYSPAVDAICLMLRGCGLNIKFIAI